MLYQIIESQSQERFLRGRFRSKKAAERAIAAYWDSLRRGSVFLGQATFESHYQHHLEVAPLPAKKRPTIQFSSGWTDMSNFVFHFTKGNSGRSDYDNMMSILYDGILKASGSFGFRHSKIPAKAVCFSEIPLAHMSRIARRRGAYGIGFRKDVAVAKGANPIWYVDTRSQLAKELKASPIATRGTGAALRDYLSPWIDFAGPTARSIYRFDWEREWRCAGDFSFSAEDVAFLIIPEKSHKMAFSFFQDAIVEHSGPGYLCPYIDIGWDQKQIRAAFKEW